MACTIVESVSSSIQYTRETMPGAQYYDGKKLNIPISKEAGIELIERWTHQGISSIMACIATQQSVFHMTCNLMQRGNCFFLEV
ncbi:hypothetical protein LOAG_00422 [Loa loa]|uniref:Uncharacterized protein n=1 Tax=Loa loa TaxID=7209 RepID=A0A1S0UBI5_LOALO|nr:hypothetical protein LOAG_00422 [Loa loa]EFO28068.1 hypothetical protein LOAG_00422 [Loa loa]